MNFYIAPEISFLTSELDYLLKLWSVNTGLQAHIVTSPENSIIIGRIGSESHLFIGDSFLNSDLNANQLNKNCLFECSGGIPDYLTTAFYMINSLQEYDNQNCDDLGRFKFTGSYQYAYNNVTHNVVQRCFDKISEVAKTDPSRKKTKFFLTHDIDTVYGGLYEDGFNVLKKGRFDLFFKFLFEVALGKPHWLNIDKILKLESEYDCRSVFYWLVNKGRINKREVNADYDFKSNTIQKQFKEVADIGFENGLHKSLAPDSFQEEIKKFGELPLGNRYHYLKFNLPAAYHDVQQANLKIDASLAFAESIGFRNNYGLPFNPYNFKTKKPFKFVEAPLHVMDRTFFQYNGIDALAAEKRIFDFFERNKENCVLSVLWHNNFFTEYKYKGYLALYKKILVYIKENQLSTVSSSDIIKDYSIA